MQSDYAHLKNFSVDLSPGFQNDQAFPGPPNLAHVDLPHRYEYQQAPGVVVVPDADGNLIAKNVHGPARKITWALPPDIEEVPQVPPDNIPKTSPHGVLLPRAIRDLEKLLEERPLVTKRVALNAIPACSDTIFKEATQFVGYSFGAGPWRDTLIKYGVDPRKDPKYRIYQTLMFQMDKKEFKAANGSTSQWSRSVRFKKDSLTSHIFDGTSFTLNGKTWQVCDLTDPVLAQIAATDDLRAECDVQRDGWYHNGTLAKLRAVMKDKFRLLFAGETPKNDDYDAILKLPDELHQGNIQETIFPEKRYGKRLGRIALDIRNVSKARKMVKEGFVSASIPSAEIEESVAHVLAEDAEQDASDGDEEAAMGDFDEPTMPDVDSRAGQAVI
jgi:general transcription factor 3C polypeptide 5 (transcription factor C subunit 1)